MGNRHEIELCFLGVGGNCLGSDRVGISLSAEMDPISKSPNRSLSTWFVLSVSLIGPITFMGFHISNRDPLAMLAGFVVALTIAPLSVVIALFSLAQCRTRPLILLLLLLCLANLGLFAATLLALVTGSN